MEVDQWVYHRKLMIQGKIRDIRKGEVAVELARELPVRVWKLGEVGFLEELYGREEGKLEELIPPVVEFQPFPGKLGGLKDA